MKMKTIMTQGQGAARYCNSIWQGIVPTWYNDVKFRKILNIPAGMQPYQAHRETMLAGGAAQ
jgi:hypothetical protein